jgi:polyhydroxyalkanoate synthesis regulator phasin
MAENKDMIVPMLREMRQEISKRFDGVDGRIDKVERRLSGLEEGQKSQRQALVADTMMSKFMAGDFEERIQALEQKVEALAKARQ